MLKTVICILLTLYALTPGLAQVKRADTLIDVEKGESLNKVFSKVRAQTEYRRTGSLPDNLVAREKCRKCAFPQVLQKALWPGHFKLFIQGKDYEITALHTFYPAVSGIVTSSTGEPLTGVTVYNPDTKIRTTTNKKGEYTVYWIFATTDLQFTYVSTEPRIVTVANSAVINVTLTPKAVTMDEHVLTEISNGYQQIKQPHITGAATAVDIEHNSPAYPYSTQLLDNGRYNVLSHHSQLHIRGISTIKSNQRPLIVLDNFPYDGDFNDIQPDEIESISILKDAAATAIWGIRAANGVIAITTKHGRFSKPMKTEVGSGIFYTPAFNLNKDPNYLSSSDFIDVEQFLYKNGYYANSFNDLVTPVSQAVQIMHDYQNNDDIVQHKLDSMRKNDVRNDLRKYFYQPAITQRYTLNITGGDSNNAYATFMAYERATTGRTNNLQQHFMLSANNQRDWFHHKLQLFTSARLGYNIDRNNNLADPPELLPYNKLADEAGTPLPVIKDYKENYPDVADAGRLLDWKYRPKDELGLANNKLNNINLIVGGYIHYKFSANWSAQFLYRLDKRTTATDDIKSVQTYYTRNLINTYTQVQGNTISYGIPIGDIIDKGQDKYNASNSGLRLQYQKEWDTLKKPGHFIDVLAGIDIRKVNKQISLTRLYGYDENNGTNKQPIYNTPYPLYTGATAAIVPNPDRRVTGNENYVSGYLTATYNYCKQLTISGSLRRDQSNLFDSSINTKWHPLWSAGIAWELSRAGFWKLPIPYFRIRSSTGLRGNAYDRASGKTLLDYGTNSLGRTAAAIVNLSDRDLRWEKSRMNNLGIDMSLNKDRVSLTADMFVNYNTDLFADATVDIGTGRQYNVRNSAAMTTKGFEIALTVNNNLGPVKWACSWWINHVTNKVTQYTGRPVSVGAYCTDSNFIPLTGNPLNAIYSVKMEGLDHNDGQMIVKLNGVRRFDYSTILNGTDYAYLTYHGSATPTWYAVWNNTFRWKGFTLSADIAFKLGYYFRRTSINYYDLFLNHTGHIDYLRRWQHPGDEKTTNVPAMIYHSQPDPDTYYSLSGYLVERADHIRLQQVSLSYRLNKNSYSWLPFEYVLFNAGINNLGLLRKANHSNIDPEFSNGVTPRPTYLLSIKMSLHP
jgi:TonB-linked SusC/RagA family outer membrane protein